MKRSTEIQVSRKLKQNPRINRTSVSAPFRCPYSSEGVLTRNCSLLVEYNGLECLRQESTESTLSYVRQLEARVRQLEEENRMLPQVLDVQETIDRQQGKEYDHDLSETEKAIVREMCNVLKNYSVYFELHYKNDPEHSMANSSDGTQRHRMHTWAGYMLPDGSMTPRVREGEESLQCLPKPKSIEPSWVFSAGICSQLLQTGHKQSLAFVWLNGFCGTVISQAQKSQLTCTQLWTRCQVKFRCGSTHRFQQHPASKINFICLGASTAYQGVIALAEQS
ncbi:hypothetical protein ACRRTK_014430 [Alexandromys fortis]